MTFAVMSCDGIDVGVYKHGDKRYKSCWVKKIRVLIYDPIKQKKVVDKWFEIKFNVKWSNISHKVKRAWLLCLNYHECDWDSNGSKYESVLTIIRDMLLFNKVERIFSKGSLPARFLNEVGMYGDLCSKACSEDQDDFFYFKNKSELCTYKVIDLGNHGVGKFKDSCFSSNMEKRCDFYLEEILNKGIVK